MEVKDSQYYQEVALALLRSIVAGTPMIEAQLSAQAAQVYATLALVEATRGRRES